MKQNDLRKIFLAKFGAAEDQPFGPTVYVYKVAGKMFGTMGADEDPARINLKCDPEEALMLRKHYESVIPGYHMNKTHWNTIICDGSIPKDEIIEMIDDSYDLIVEKLPKSTRAKLGGN
jgi:predicted DNA-binding protein (MmcQ/YjbR family)